MKSTADYYFNMFLKHIESDKQAFEAYIKKSGYTENLGQIEYREFNDKINASDYLFHGQKADLAGRYTDMLSML